MRARRSIRRFAVAGAVAGALSAASCTLLNSRDDYLASDDPGRSGFGGRAPRNDGGGDDGGDDATLTPATADAGLGDDASGAPLACPSFVEVYYLAKLEGAGVSLAVVYTASESEARILTGEDPDPSAGTENPTHLKNPSAFRAVAVPRTSDPPPRGTVPVYRLHNLATDDRLYTTGAVEKSKAMSGGYDHDEGIAFYAVPTALGAEMPPGCVVPIEGFTKNGYHHLGARPADRKSYGDLGFMSEGIRFYAALP